MKVTKNSTPRVLCPEGNHITILTQILDWGTQTDSYGKRRKVELIWETPEELHVFNEERGEEPFIIDRKFALTIGKNSALADALVGLTGKSIEEDELDLEEYLGTVGMVNVKHKEDGDYTNLEITSYGPLSKSDAKRKFKPHGEYKILDLENFDQEVFDSLPDWKQKKISESDEYKALVAGKVAKAVGAKSDAGAKGQAVSGKSNAKAASGKAAATKTAPKGGASKSKNLFK